MELIVRGSFQPDWSAANIAEMRFAVFDIAAATQAVEHYEITRCGMLVALNKQLGCSACATVLAETLAGEKATDEKLTTRAETKVNSNAELKSA